VMLLLLIVIFIGFLNHFRAMYWESRPLGQAEAADPTINVNAWMTLPMWLALIPVLVLGLWWPQDLWRFFELVAADLGGGVR
jgi:hydrogenase-4 component F